MQTQVVAANAPEHRLPREAVSTLNNRVDGWKQSVSGIHFVNVAIHANNPSFSGRRAATDASREIYRSHGPIRSFLPYNVVV